MPEPKGTASNSSSFAATDMLHRRVPLPYRVKISVNGQSRFIKTNSPLMAEALNSIEIAAGAICDTMAEWQISVEVRQDDTQRSIEQAKLRVDTYHFGPSRALRISGGSWFAYTPPSLHGVGFAIVAGDECSQTRQLAAYLKAVVLLQANGNTATSCASECEAAK